MTVVLAFRPVRISNSTGEIVRATLLAWAEIWDTTAKTFFARGADADAQECFSRAYQLRLKAAATA